MVLEVASFGTISTFFKNLKPSRSKREIANHFGLDISTFESWFHTMAYIRNACAHHARMWNKLISIRPQIPRSPLKQWLKSPRIDNRRIYFILSSILYLLQTVNPHSRFKKNLFKLFKKYPTVDISAMGFPADFRNEKLWIVDNQSFNLFFWIKNLFSF